MGTKVTSTPQPVKAAQDNRANQLNPNNSAYWSSRRITSPPPPPKSAPTPKKSS